MAELCGDDANPFWKRLLAPGQNYGVDVKPIAPVIEQALDTGMTTAA